MVKRNQNILAAFSVVIFAIFALGSAPAPVVDTTKVAIYNGYFVNEGIVIEAEDESFSLQGGQAFNTPFSVSSWDHPVQSFNFNSDQTTLGSWNDALRLGAKNVKVWQKGRSQPLYGVLMFSDVYRSAVGPGARSYQLQIPESRLNSAASGNLTWVGEKVDFEYRWEGRGYKGFKYSWVLWLSNTPFRDPSVPAPQTRAEREAASKAAQLRAELEAQRKVEEARVKAQQAATSGGESVASESQSAETVEEKKNPIEALGNTLKGLFGGSSSEE